MTCQMLQNWLSPEGDQRRTKGNLKPKKKDTKKQKKDKVIGLTSYSEPSDKGTSDKLSSGIFTSIQVDTIPSSPTTQKKNTTSYHNHSYFNTNFYPILSKPI